MIERIEIISHPRDPEKMDRWTARWRVQKDGKLYGSHINFDWNWDCVKNAIPLLVKNMIETMEEVEKQDGN